MTEARQLMQELWKLKGLMTRAWSEVDEMALTERERDSLRALLVETATDVAALIKRLNAAERGGQKEM